MLYLAQVIKNINSDKLQLHLLASEESKSQWNLCDDKYLLVEEEKDLPEGAFLLVELDHNNQILQYQSAKNWILNLIRLYLVEEKNNSNLNLSEERARLEKWRQELTAQSQELTRIRLEIETTREELQELEQNLARKKETSKSQHNYQ